MARMTQKEMIFRHLRDGNSISSAECFSEYGFVDLQSIIRTLRQEGHNIKDEWRCKTNRYDDPVRFKVYWLAAPPRNLLEIMEQGTKNETAY